MGRGRIFIILTLVLLVGCIFVGCGDLAKSTAEWHYNYSVDLYDEGRYDGAIEEYTKAIELDYNFAIAYNNRGAAYNYKGQYDLAIADCTKTIELDPNLAMAYNNRGAAYSNKGQYDLPSLTTPRPSRLTPTSLGPTTTGD